MPFAAILLYLVRDLEPGLRDIAWGLAAGVIAFLALAHAMTLVLVDHALLGLLADDLSSSLVAIVGLSIGVGVAWALFEGPLIRIEGERILWAGVAFLGLHSFADGLVLGVGFVGIGGPGYRIDAAATAATVVHRFAEGAIVVLPALAARWRPPLALGPPSAGPPPHPPPSRRRCAGSAPRPPVRRGSHRRPPGARGPMAPPAGPRDREEACGQEP